VLAAEFSLSHASRTMKYITAFSAILLCSCYRTNFATTSQTARISGKTAAIHTWLGAGEKHAFIAKIDGQTVRGTRTFTVDAGKRVIEANFTGAGRYPYYTGGSATLAPVLKANHVYQVASGLNATSNTAFVYDITDGKREAVISVPMQGQ
jgi:hypothetical protein